jgi:hypothetical protein
MRYYGSTIQTLNARLRKHKDDYKLWLKGEKRYCKSFDIISKGNYEIKLVRFYPCNNKPELDRKEGRYILKNECINKVVPGRTKKEYNKIYRQQNKDKIRDKKREYRQQNKEKIKEYKNTVIDCPCGRTYTRCHKLRHERSQFHKSNV